jgi:hypothetical protein
MVVKPSRGLDHLRDLSLVAWFDYALQSLGEIRRQLIHLGRV